MSLPSRERGLKFQFAQLTQSVDPVAPFTGAWIEIPAWISWASGARVAPFTGAWIEMLNIVIDGRIGSSLPSRERGLKLPQDSRKYTSDRSLPSRERGLK